ncbi:hypothetical protein [Undibacterium sp. TC9W]|uniref:hypothetical protein n=1 Tax=Undibacterium sp. TC9W TaxID=3413053 RepID=UPI003BEF6D7A
MNEEQLRAELKAVYASSSWKLTAPMRYSVELLKNGGLPKLLRDIKLVLKKLMPAKVDKTEVAEVMPDRLNDEGQRILNELQSRMQRSRSISRQK